MRIRHRRQRGAALAEFVIVAPIIILLWGCAKYFWQAYEYSIEARHAARAEAWQRASSGDCPGSFGITEFTGDFVTSQLAAEVVAQSTVVMGDLTQSMKSVEAHATLPPAPMPAMLRSFMQPKGVGATTYLLCNGKLPNSDNDVFLPFVDIWLQYARVE
jgi:hypothetical protein